jgi:hypothetical protein
MTPTSWAAVVRSLSGAAGPWLQPDKADASNTAMAAPENEKSDEKDKGRGADSSAFPQQPGSPNLLRPPGLRDLESLTSRASLVVHDMAFFSFVEGPFDASGCGRLLGERAGRSRLRVVGQGKGNPGPLSFVNSARYPAPGTPTHAFFK